MPFQHMMCGLALLTQAASVTVGGEGPGLMRSEPEKEAERVEHTAHSDKVTVPHEAGGTEEGPHP